MKNCGYIGKIGNTPAQYVQAPVKPVSPKGKIAVKKGKDLRTGK